MPNQDNYKFVKHLIRDIEKKVKHNKRTLEKLAKSYGITNQTEVKELSELAIVKTARRIINSTTGTGETFNKIVELYDTQYNLSMRTSHSMLLQQYSTPAPISYLASLYVKSNDKDALYFEPSAGNGLLTIALPYTQTYVNEIDELRHKNLKAQPFARITQKDASTNFVEYKHKFDGVITNPPFARLPEPVKVGTFRIQHLDHIMSIVALDAMKEDGKAAIIIGGHSTWDKKGRLTKGKNRLFLNYLYHHYNVEDVISINGKKLYTKQGTGFDVRLILINGRKKTPSGAAPVKNETLSTVINSYPELWQRVNPGQDDRKLKKLQLRARALILLQQQSSLSGLTNKEEAIEWARTHLVDKKVFHKELGKYVQFTPQGVKHAVSNKTNPLKIALIYDAEKLIKESKVIEIKPDRKKRKDIKRIIRLKALWEYNNVTYNAFIIVREGHNGHIYYDHIAIKKP